MSSTRRDVSWAVLFRLERTGVWCEWSKGHRTPPEAVTAGELPAKIPSVADVCFQRTIVQRDTFTLDEMAPAEDATVQQSAPADRLARIAQAHCKDQAPGGTTSGSCTECDHAWPCPTYVWASTERDWLATWDPADDDGNSS